MSTEARAGWHAVSALLAQQPDQVLRVWVQLGREDARASHLKAELSQLGIRCEAVPKSVLDKQTAHHQGVIAWVKVRDLPGESELAGFLEALDHPPFLLVLDEVQDPHNLGACLRSADAAGVDAVILPRHQSASITPTVRKVACGAAESVPVFQVTNLVRTLELLKQQGVWISGLALDDRAVSVYQADWTGPLAIVMGAEDKGLRRLTREACDRLVIIPMLGQVQSLNVSVATGVVLYQALAQRLSAT